MEWGIGSTLGEGYLLVVIIAKAIMREWNKNNCDTIENRDICLTIYTVDEKNIDIVQA